MNCDPPYENTSLNMAIWVKPGFKRVSKGFQTPETGFVKGLQTVCREFQRVSKGFQIPETAFLKGFHRVCKEFPKGFQRVSKAF